MIAEKERVLSERQKELEKALSTIVEMSRGENERVLLVEKMKKEVVLLNEQVKEERKERKIALLARDEAENTVNESSGAVAELTEENTNLKRR